MVPIKIDAIEMDTAIVCHANDSGRERNTDNVWVFWATIKLTELNINELATVVWTLETLLPTDRRSLKCNLYFIYEIQKTNSLKQHTQRTFLNDLRSVWAGSVSQSVSSLIVIHQPKYLMMLLESWIFMPDGQNKAKHKAMCFDENGPFNLV